jgi:phosphopantothenoylcysteine decarboxylase/phosphopantothenate--cysteine ligase
VEVETAAELRDAVRASAADADVVVMAAAVADFRPAAPSPHKIKKTDGEPTSIALERTTDVLAELATDPLRPDQVLVGFAAETGDEGADVLAHGRSKGRRKGAHLLAVNAVGGGRGFGADTNAVTVLDARGDVVARATGTKDAVADAVWDAVVDVLSPRDR